MFFNRNAIKETPLSSLKNKTLFMDLDFSYSLLQQNQLEANIDKQFSKFKKQLKKFDIEFQGICQGSDPLIGNDYIQVIEQFPRHFQSFI